MTHERIGIRSLEIDLPRPVGITAMCGPAGAGKTATLEAIAGFARPERGRILIDHAIVFDADSRVNLAPRRSRCGWVGWCDAVFPHMRGRQNLLFGAGRLCRRERRDRQAELLAQYT